MIMNHTTIALTAVIGAVAAILVIGLIDLVSVEAYALGLNTNSGTPITQGSDGGPMGMVMPNMNAAGPTGGQQSQGPMSLMGPGAGSLGHAGGGPMGMISGLLNNLPLSSGSTK
jgi:hypothetical protein